MKSPLWSNMLAVLKFLFSLLGTATALVLFSVAEKFFGSYGMLLGSTSLLAGFIYMSESKVRSLFFCLPFLFIGWQRNEVIPIAPIAFLMNWYMITSFSNRGSISRTDQSVLEFKDRLHSFLKIYGNLRDFFNVDEWAEEYARDPEALKQKLGSIYGHDVVHEGLFSMLSAEKMRKRKLLSDARKDALREQNRIIQEKVLKLKQKQKEMGLL